MIIRRLVPALAATAVLLSAVSASAQSAKFAASWDDEERIAHAYVDADMDSPLCHAGQGDGTEERPCVLAEALLTTIRVPQSKDLLIGVSGQIGLHTFTQAKGKSNDPTIGSASASGRVDVRVELRDPETQEVLQVAAPGTVTFAARVQELKVDLASLDPLYPTELVVSLMLETTAAHHFNFLGVDLAQGDYQVVAIFDLSAFVDIVGEDAIAESKVTLGPRMVTAEEVRAAKGSLVAFE